MEVKPKQEAVLHSGSVGNMSALLGPPGEQLCVFLMRDEVADEEVEMKWREVGCQWESPEEERKEVGCQWECPEEERRDVAIQVDLPTQQLDWTHTGDMSCDISLQLMNFWFIL